MKHLSLLFYHQCLRKQLRDYTGTVLEGTFDCLIPVVPILNFETQNLTSYYNLLITKANHKLTIGALYG